MCSIEEAWAGQTFSGKQVSSQSDIHKSYMALPDDITNHNNQFSLKSNNAPPPRDLTRGINSKYSREPRVPNINRKIDNSNNSGISDNSNINFSSIMPPLDNYGGIKPRPAYMEIYDKSVPMPVMSGERFTNIENAFEVSNTVNNFMQSGMNNELLNEGTSEEFDIINNKISVKERQNENNNNNNNNNFTNIKQTSKYNSSDRVNYNDESSNVSSNASSNVSSNETQILIILQQILDKLDKLDKIERDLHSHQSRNMYDIILYIIMGMILSFILYSICIKIK